MGNYTEIVLACKLKADIDDSILRDLALWFGEIELEPGIPHPWFYCTFSPPDSTSFPGIHTYSLTHCESDDRFCLTVRANRKNYDKEIDEFLGWLAPHSATEGFVGYLHHELEINPKLVFFVGGKAFLRQISAYKETEAHRPEREQGLPPRWGTP